MKKPTTIDEVQKLKEELQQVRARSLAASREGDFRTVARLTTETARINRAIHTQEEFAGCSAKALALVDALANIGDDGHFEFPEEEAVVVTSSAVFQEAA